MGGGYIHCGDFSGDDKSCSAISGVFEELPSLLPESQRDTFCREILTPIEAQLDENGDFFKISPKVSARMLPVVEALFSKYQERFGDAEVWDVIEMEGSSDAGSIDLKWGKGAGWRYYCLTDLRVALQRSVEHGDDVLVHFD